MNTSDLGGAGPEDPNEATRLGVQRIDLAVGATDEKAAANDCRLRIRAV
jgi:hypothetical protein